MRQVIPGNVGLCLSQDSVLYLPIQCTFRRPKLQKHYEIQNQSKFWNTLFFSGSSTVCKGYRDCMEAHIHICKHQHGTFHTILNLIASNDVSMRDMCIVPGIIAVGTISGVSIEECTTEQKNIGEMEGILSEAGG